MYQSAGWTTTIMLKNTENSRHVTGPAFVLALFGSDRKICSYNDLGSSRKSNSRNTNMYGRESQAGRGISIWGEISLGSPFPANGEPHLLFTQNNAPGRTINCANDVPAVRKKGICPEADAFISNNYNKLKIQFPIRIQKPHILGTPFKCRLFQTFQGLKNRSILISF